jgi:HSP20 family protein
MSLIPWRNERTPSRRASTLASLIDRFFEEPFSDGFPELFRSVSMPPVNVAEDEKAFTVTAELPGMDPKDIHLEVMGNQLLISGERKFEEEKKEKDYHRIESRYGSFSRTIGLPSAVRPDAIDATYKNGMLSVTVPKVEPTPTTKVKVKSGS